MTGYTGARSLPKIQLSRKGSHSSTRWSCAKLESTEWMIAAEVARTANELVEKKVARPVADFLLFIFCNVRKIWNAQELIIAFIRSLSKSYSIFCDGK